MPTVVEFWRHAAAMACILASSITVVLWIVGPRGPNNRARMYRAIWALLALGILPLAIVVTLAAAERSDAMTALIAASMTLVYAALTFATAAQSAHPRHSFIGASVLILFAIAATGVLT